MGLRERVRQELAADPARVYDIKLSYLTSRGRWYFASWKGDISKSGGVATNIGVHFFDMLSWIFGPVRENRVHHHQPDTAAGFLDTGPYPGALVSFDQRGVSSGGGQGERSAHLSGDHRGRRGVRVQRRVHTIVCGVIIGEYAFVGAGAVINRDVPPYALMVGVPARQVGWISRHGERLDLPLQGQAEARCPATGENYRLAGDQVRRIEE